MFLLQTVDANQDRADAAHVAAGPVAARRMGKAGRPPCSGAATRSDASAGPPHRLARSAPRAPRPCWATAAIGAADSDTMHHAPLPPADRSGTGASRMRMGALMRMARA
ncbi:hypothetical protein CO683_36360 [Bradyrhizobium ottawaense]|nr:hypothetical protein CO683_36360 [Bradyrhizobium ottawaense]